jgi:hypothetical protein
VAGYSIVTQRRKSSAHHQRPWRAIPEFAIAADRHAGVAFRANQPCQIIIFNLFQLLVSPS